MDQGKSVSDVEDSLDSLPGSINSSLEARCITLAIKL